jgi:iron complex transport system ATP-binding protein
VTRSPDPPALRLTSVDVVRPPVTILQGVDWTIAPGERWVVLGPNGSGKTTLLRLASLYLHPTRGTVEVLGERLGRVDVRRHRRRVGLVSPAFADLLRPDLPALDAVMSARDAALETWWHTYGDEDRAHALELLARVGADRLADRTFGTLSSGERQRVLLARSLWGSPGLVLLDEPAAGLDLGAREELVDRLRALAGDPSTPPTVLVTHHVEEIPAGFTHALLLRGGRVVAAGPLGEVLTAEALSETFGLALALDRRDGRFAARVVAGAGAGPEARARVSRPAG